MFVFLSKESLNCELGHHEEHQDEGPHYDMNCVVMPKCHKNYHTQHWQYVLIAAQGYVHVSDQPMIETFVPHSPKFLKPIVIEHTPPHIIYHIDPAQQCPHSTDSPYNCEL